MRHSGASGTFKLKHPNLRVTGLDFRADSINIQVAVKGGEGMRPPRGGLGGERSHQLRRPLREHPRIRVRKREMPGKERPGVKSNLQSGATLAKGTAHLEGGGGAGSATCSMEVSVKYLSWGRAEH